MAAGALTSGWPAGARIWLRSARLLGVIGTSSARTSPPVSVSIAKASPMLALQSRETSLQMWDGVRSSAFARRLWLHSRGYRLKSCLSVTPGFYGSVQHFVKD